MELHKIVMASFKNILMALAVIALALPILLSMPGFSGFVLNALSMFGIGE